MTQVTAGDNAEYTGAEIAGVAKSFAGVPVLKDVSLSLRAGQVLGLVGENGAGKSTLMNILGGVLPPDQGIILLAGGRYQPHSPADAKAAGVAFIHQELNLFANLSVAENIFLTDLPRHRSWWPVVDRAALAAQTLPLLQAVDLKVPPWASVDGLSPGERQLVEIAKALALDARVVIFDEPTTSLTAPEVQRLFAIIDRLRGEGRAVVFISHVLDDVLSLCDDVAVLRDGRVVQQGPAAGFDKASMVAAMVGRTVDQLYPVRAAALVPGPPLLEVRGLTRTGAVEDASFQLRAGEVLGVAGLMGAGRTELARLVFGLDRANRGEIQLDGKSVAMPTSARSVASGIAFLTESRRSDGLVMDFSMAQNVAIAALPRFAHGVWGWLDRELLAAASDGAVVTMRVQENARHQPSVRYLSGGNQQKVVLAKWLLTRPRLFILDEPTRGIDVGARQEIYGWIASSVREGMAVLLISSELEELIGLSDRILVMRKGRIAGTLHRPEFDRERILRLALDGQGAS